MPKHKPPTDIDIDDDVDPGQPENTGGPSFLRAMREKLDPSASAQMLMSAYQDYKSTSDAQQPRLAEIQADREKAVATIEKNIRIHCRKAERIFSQTDKDIDAFLQEFSSACENGDSGAQQASLAKVLGALQKSSSAVASGVRLWEAMNNPDAKQLEDV